MILSKSRSNNRQPLKRGEKEKLIQNHNLGSSKDTPGELNMQPANLVIRQANNCLNPPCPTQGSLLQILNLIHKLLALVDAGPATHATPSVPDGQCTSVSKKRNNSELKSRKQ